MLDHNLSMWCRYGRRLLVNLASIISSQETAWGTYWGSMRNIALDQPVGWLLLSWTLTNFALHPDQFMQADLSKLTELVCGVFDTGFDALIFNGFPVWILQEEWLYSFLCVLKVSVILIPGVIRSGWIILNADSSIQFTWPLSHLRYQDRGSQLLAIGLDRRYRVCDKSLPARLPSKGY